MIAERPTKREEGRTRAGVIAEPLPPAPPRNVPTPQYEAPETVRPMGYRGSRPVRQVRAIAEQRPQILALFASAFIVTLMCLYVTAYARVNGDQRALRKMQVQLRDAQVEEEDLRRKIGATTEPASIRLGAKNQGMVPAPAESVEVILVPSATSLDKP
jgi:hypothetical protein